MPPSSKNGKLSWLFGRRQVLSWPHYVLPVFLIASLPKNSFSAHLLALSLSSLICSNTPFVLDLFPFFPCSCCSPLWIEITLTKHILTKWNGVEASQSFQTQLSQFLTVGQKVSKCFADSTCIHFGVKCVCTGHNFVILHWVCTTSRGGMNWVIECTSRRPKDILRPDIQQLELYMMKIQIRGKCFSITQSLSKWNGVRLWKSILDRSWVRALERMHQAPAYQYSSPESLTG